MSRFLLSSSPAGVAGMGPAGTGPGAQGATIGAALLPTRTGSGPAPARLLSYDTMMVGLAQTRPCRGASTEGVTVQARENQCQWHTARVPKSVFPGRGNGATGVYQSIL